MKSLIHIYRAIHIYLLQLHDVRVDLNDDDVVFYAQDNRLLDLMREGVVAVRNLGDVSANNAI